MQAFRYSRILFPIFELNAFNSQSMTEKKNSRDETCGHICIKENECVVGGFLTSGSSVWLLCSQLKMETPVLSAFLQMERFSNSLFTCDTQTPECPASVWPTQVTMLLSPTLLKTTWGGTWYNADVN